MARKILFCVSAMSSGGAERVAANLANAWVERGYQVTLVVTYSKRGECFYALSDKIQLCYLSDLVGSFDRLGLFVQFKRLFALRRLIKTIQPDVVLSFLTNVNVATILAAWGSGYAVVVSERIYPPMEPVGRFYNILRVLTYPYAASIVVQTKMGMQWIIENIRGAQGSVIPNPIPYPLSVFEPKLAPQTLLADGRKLLLGVGRLADQKRFDCCLMSFATLAKRYGDWDLVILGEGPLRGALESQIRALGLESRVHLPGGVGNVGDWYARADLYVMSSSFEGFPNTLVEAMAHGCAVVSYDCDTGPRDIIRDGEDGLLVNPVGDVTALTSALDQLMGDDKRRERMAQKAVDVRERFSVESILAMWDEVFSKIIAQQGKNRHRST
ncbi:glycosyl transferase [Nitrosomonas sp. PY1]|uniref:glycosyltransferase family 4 protein n=1 Tax=Nitrosomonas sp. PY1 TaxID=1803906 RepID=UPI001FC88B71|nr:glycosyltransferase family 4 protein [Nitrosomonas sp. PY1]GKS70025.1 glycosyl transferase [Nitrosomonas sp. PY1]